MQHTDFLSTSCGSPHYAAPEIAMGQRYRGNKIDIWSCGVVFYALLTGTLPFGARRRNAKQSDILADIIDGYFEIPDHVSDDAQDLLFRMLQRDPGDRIDICDMWEQPIILKHQDYQPYGEPTVPWFGGPAPILTSADCGEQITGRQDIDKDLLDSLCILWYSIPEEDIVEALLDPEYV